MHLEAGDGDTKVEKNTERAIGRTLWGSEIQTKNGAKYEEMYEEVLNYKKLCDNSRKRIIALVDSVRVRARVVGKDVKTIFTADKKIKKWRLQMESPFCVCFDYANGFSVGYGRAFG